MKRHEPSDPRGQRSKGGHKNLRDWRLSCDILGSLRNPKDKRKKKYKKTPQIELGFERLSSKGLGITSKTLNLN